MIIGGIITWFLKTRSEELKATEEKLHEARRKIYIEILDPYIRLFSDSGGQGAQHVIKKIKSVDYKKTAFELNIFGSDEVIREKILGEGDIALPGYPKFQQLLIEMHTACRSGVPDSGDEGIPFSPIGGVICTRCGGKIGLEIPHPLAVRRSRYSWVDEARTRLTHHQGR